MKWGVILLFAAAALPGAACATAYSDFERGINAYNDHDSATVIAAMSAALASPDLPAHLRPAALLDRAFAYVNDKKYDLAMADYTACLSLDPDNYAALMGRGAVLAMRKDHDRARADFADAIRIRPGLPSPYIDHARTFLAERRFDDALKDYADGLRASWWTLDFYLLRSEVFRRSGRYQEAIKEDDTALSRYSDYADAFAMRGRAKDDSGDLKGALADYEKAADLGEQGPQLWLVEGVAQWKLGNFVEAERVFKRAGDRDDYLLIWTYLAQAKQKWVAKKLTERAASIKTADWPAPLVKLIGGTGSADEVLEIATEEPDADLRSDRTCDADFYIGEWDMFHDDVSKGKQLLTEASKACEMGSIERGAALVELGRSQ